MASVSASANEQTRGRVMSRWVYSPAPAEAKIGIELSRVCLVQRFGTGDTFDEAKLHTTNVGNFLLMPKGMHHFALNQGDTIVQAHGIGPFKVNWLNPSDVQPPDSTAAPKKNSRQQNFASGAYADHGGRLPCGARHERIRRVQATASNDRLLLPEGPRSRGVQ